MSVLSGCNRKVDKLTVVVGLAAILWFSRWVIFDFLFPLQEFKGYGKTIEQHVQGRGYTLETHKAVTEDGYILEFHRISNPNVTGQESRTPVVLAPAFLCSSKTQVSFNNSASYMFADDGFDVWLLNSRGSFYGRQHISLDEDKDRLAFYNYTLIELATYDLPAQLLHIKKVTAKEKVNFVAYSQGVTTFLTMLAKRPAMQNSIEKAVLYGGAHTTCFAKTGGDGVHAFINLNYYIADILYFFGVSHVRGPAYFLHRFPFLLPKIQHAVRMTETGLMNEEHFTLQVESFEETTGWLMMSHSLQNGFPGCDGRMREFNYDFGMFSRFLTWIGLKSSKNIEVYGTREPPAIDIENFSLPVKIYHGEGDHEITPEGVRKLAERLKIPASNVHTIAEKRFNHFNFLYNHRRLHFIDHAIDFLKGNNSEWDPHVFDEPSES